VIGIIAAFVCVVAVVTGAIFAIHQKNKVRIYSYSRLPAGVLMMIAASLIVLLGSKYNMIVIGFCDGLQKDHEHASASLGTQDMTRRISLVFPQHKVSKPSMLTPEMSNKTIHTSNYNV